MLRALFVLVLLLGGLPTQARETHPYLTRPFFSIPLPGLNKSLADSRELLQNMRLGCTATVTMGVARKECLELADRLHSLVVLSNEQIKHLVLLKKNLSKEVQDALKAAIDKKFEEILTLSDQLYEQYPKVGSFLSPTLRYNI